MRERYTQLIRRFALRVALGGVLAAAATWCVAAQDPAMDVSSLTRRAAALEKQWQARGPAATAYFQDSLTLLKSGMAPTAKDDPRGRAQQLLEIGRNALQKNISSLPDVDRVPLYKAQTDIASALPSVTLANVKDDTAAADLRNAYAQTLTAYVTSLAKAGSAIVVKGKPSLNVAPPASTGGGAASGMAPSSIKDPAARAAYEAAIKDNEKLAAATRERAFLTHSVQGLSKQLEMYLRSQYMRAPAREAELRTHLAALASAQAAASHSQ